MAFNNKYDHTKSEAFFDDEPLRHRSSVFSKRARSNLEEVPMWPVITGLAVLFIWAVNVVSPGALSFITGFSFVDSLMLGIIIGSLYAIAQYRKGSTIIWWKRSWRTLRRKKQRNSRQCTTVHSPLTVKPIIHNLQFIIHNYCKATT